MAASTVSHPCVGTRWFIWGEHQTISDVWIRRDEQNELYVRLIPDNPKHPKKKYPPVALWRVKKYGRPSDA